MRGIKSRGQSGFSFIEVLIVLTLIAICIIPLMQVLGSSIPLTSKTQLREMAMNVARQQMETMKAQTKLSDMSAGLKRSTYALPPVTTVTTGKIDFRVTTSWIPDAELPATYLTATEYDYYLPIRIIVGWNEGSGRDSIKYDFYMISTFSPTPSP